MDETLLEQLGVIDADAETRQVMRRYFVVNGFDGIATVIGLSISAYLLHISTGYALFLTGTGMAVGLLASGAVSAYFTEQAAQMRKYHDSSDNTSETIPGTVRKNALLVGGVNGGSPFLCAMICLSPYLLAHFGYLDMFWDAYYVSFGISGILFLLFGAYLGRISNKSLFRYTGKMAVLGGAVGGIIIGVTYYLWVNGLLVG